MRIQNIVAFVVLALISLAALGCQSNPFAGVGRAIEDASEGAERLFTSEVRLNSIDEAKGNPQDPVNRRVIAEGALLLPSVADGFLFREAWDLESKADKVDADITKLSASDPNIVTQSRTAADLHKQALQRELDLTNERLEQAVSEKEAAETNRSTAIQEGLSTTVIDNKITDLEAWRKFLQTHRDLIQGRLNALG